MAKTVEEINKARADNVASGVDAYAGTGTKGQSFIPSPSTVGGAFTNSGIISQDGVTPITSQSLAPATPLVTPVAPTQTASIGLTAGAESLANTVKAQAQQQEDLRLTQLKEEKDRGANDIASAISSLGGQEVKRADAYEAGGLNTQKAELDNVTSAMEAANLAARRKEEEIIKNNPNGLVGTGAQGEIDRIRRENASYQADQAIVLSALGRNYDRAKGIIDQKIDAQTEQIKADLDAKKFFYQENKESFTKAEQRQYEAMLTKDEREYNDKKVALKSLEDTKLEAMKNAQENGAPASVLQSISSATTPEQVITNAGSYGRDLKRKLEIAKLNKDLQATGAPTITNPKALPYAGALSTILGSANFTKDQAAAVVNSINNGDDPFVVVRNRAKDIMPATEAATVSKLETAQSAMKDLDTDLKEFYTNGGDTGIFKGNYEQAVNKIGNVSNPKLVELGVRIQSQLQKYRNAVSGTAYSVQEGQDIASIFPGINKSEGLNEAIISGKLKDFESTIDASYKNVLGSGYTALKAANVSTEDLAKQEAAVEKTFDDYKVAHPEKVPEINNLIKIDETTLGRPLTVSEFYQAHPEYK